MTIKGDTTGYCQFLIVFPAGESKSYMDGVLFEPVKGNSKETDE